MAASIEAADNAGINRKRHSQDAQHDHGCCRGLWPFQLDHGLVVYLRCEQKYPASAEQLWRDERADGQDETQQTAESDAWQGQGKHDAPKTRKAVGAKRCRGLLVTRLQSAKARDERERHVGHENLDHADKDSKRIV